jgi:hypothetical protein
VVVQGAAAPQLCGYVLLPRLSNLRVCGCLDPVVVLAATAQPAGSYELDQPPSCLALLRCCSSLQITLVWLRHALSIRAHCFAGDGRGGPSQVHWAKQHRELPIALQTPPGRVAHCSSAGNAFRPLVQGWATPGAVGAAAQGASTRHTEHVWQGGPPPPSTPPTGPRTANSVVGRTVSGGPKPGGGA